MSLFWQPFQTTFSGMAQIFLLGLIGYWLVKKSRLAESCLGTLSRLVVEVTLPAAIFYQLIREFNFRLYPHWWIFPLMSLVITLAGALLGRLFSVFIKGQQHQSQFLSLVAFQNSGYLPLALITAILPKQQADVMLVYLFLFLLGFNLIIWSLGVYLLSSRAARKFELGSIFSPPAVAVLTSLALVALGLNRFFPEFLLKPVKMAGDCTVPLAMFVVGGNLAQVRREQVYKGAAFLLILCKLIILPLAGLWIAWQFRLPQLFGLLLVMQLAVPSATSLSVIARHYQKEDLLISQGVFFTHIAGLITLPLFLSLYLIFSAAK